MCGRYAAARDTATLVEEFGVDEVAEQAPAASWNVAPTQQVALVADRTGADGQVQRQLRTARWGLVPGWAKDLRIGSRMINARWEEAAGKPAFRAAIARRRCLVPADGYFEWKAPAGVGAATSTGGRPRKQPYYIHREDGSALAMAGIFEFWRAEPDSDEWVVTVAVLTTAAAGPIAEIHDRMPVLVAPADWAAWLDPAARAPADLVPASVDLLATYPVSTEVNSVRSNSAALIRPLVG